MILYELCGNTNGMTITKTVSHLDANDGNMIFIYIYILLINMKFNCLLSVSGDT